MWSKKEWISFLFNLVLAKGEHIPSLQENNSVVVTAHDLLGLAGKCHLDRDTTRTEAKGRKRREKSSIHMQYK